MQRRRLMLLGLVLLACVGKSMAQDEGEDTEHEEEDEEEEHHDHHGAFANIESIQYDIEAHVRNVTEREEISTLVEDVHELMEHITQLDDLVNEHGEVIRDEILSVMMRLGEQEQKLKERVQETYDDYHRRIDRIDEIIRRRMNEQKEEAMTDFQRFQDMAEDVLDDWQRYITVLFVVTLGVIAGFAAYFAHLRRTVVQERKRV